MHARLSLIIKGVSMLKNSWNIDQFQNRGVNIRRNVSANKEFLGTFIPVKGVSMLRIIHTTANYANI
jgi:hypothetical protein